jgi:hypothetical protein
VLVYTYRAAAEVHSVSSYRTDFARLLASASATEPGCIALRSDHPPQEVPKRKSCFVLLFVDFAFFFGTVRIWARVHFVCSCSCSLRAARSSGRRGDAACDAASDIHFGAAAQPVPERADDPDCSLSRAGGLAPERAMRGRARRAAERGQRRYSLQMGVHQQEDANGQTGLCMHQDDRGVV